MCHILYGKSKTLKKLKTLGTFTPSYFLGRSTAEVRDSPGTKLQLADRFPARFDQHQQQNRSLVAGHRRTDLLGDGHCQVWTSGRQCATPLRVHPRSEVQQKGDWNLRTGCITWRVFPMWHILSKISSNTRQGVVLNHTKHVSNGFLGRIYRKIPTWSKICHFQPRGWEMTSPHDEALNKTVSSTTGKLMFLFEGITIQSVSILMFVVLHNMILVDGIS